VQQALIIVCFGIAGRRGNRVLDERRGTFQVTDLVERTPDQKGMIRVVERSLGEPFT
jgi:hypothetical protein